jgi:hypothetical protein
VSKEQADIALDVLEECIGIVAKEQHTRSVSPFHPGLPHFS